jgi:uncharacterized protein with FMN-binding domain
MRRKHVILLIGALVILVIVVGVVMTTRIATRQMDELMDQPIEAIDLDSSPNGTYKGELKTIPVYVELEVVIEDHEIIRIELIEHRHGQGESAKAILKEIVTEQSLDVELITGATYSSKAMILAIADALSGK